MSLQQFLKYFVLMILVTSNNATSINAKVSCTSKLKDCECIEHDVKIEYFCPTKKLPETLVATYTLDTIEIFCHNQTIDITKDHLIMSDKVEVIKTDKCLLTNNFLNILNHNRTMFKKIVIDGGDIRHVDVDDILNLNVEELDISNTTGFPKLQWNTIRALKFLNLQNNSIESLPNRIPKSNIRHLELPNNKLSRLDDSTFADLDLKSLILNSNNLSILPSKLLYNSPNLQVISLFSNSISTIPENFFAKNLQLKDIFLSNNFLGDITSTIFTNLTMLNKLKLGNNGLTTLSNDFFQNLTNLNYLELNINLLKEFPDFTPLKNLKNLFLSHNRFEKIERGTFSGLSRLKSLDLCCNEISEIDNFAFDDLKMLTNLDLSHNKLKTFSDGYDNGMGVFKMEKLEHLLFGKCERINLSFNNITFIDLSYLSQSTTPPPSPRQYTTLRLVGNPINCNCELYELMKYMNNQTNVNKVKVDFKEICSESKVDTTKIEMANFMCRDSNFYECPKVCDCLIQPHTKTLKINCSGKGFTKAPFIPPLKEYKNHNMRVKEIWVNLQNNSIESFTEEEHSYKSVDVLNLSHNKLKNIEWLPEKIKALDIENSGIINMEEVPLLILNQSIALKKISLHGNRWACNCETIPLAEILKTKLMNMTTNATILCADGSPLVELDRERACKDTILLIILVTIFCTVVILIIVCIILYYHYEQHVKIWLYNHQFLFSFLKDHDLDQKKTYDAFISYSQRNEDYIVKFLVPELENGTEKYKLCLPERDWEIGEFIPKKIVDSIQNSKTTIIVLSRDFLESEWGKMEFSTAHQKSMEEAGHRLIVILYEDIDLNEVKSEDLKAYLSTNTYIKWDDPWFWKKLKNVLPRRFEEKKSKKKRTKDVEDITA